MAATTFHRVKDIINHEMVNLNETAFTIWWHGFPRKEANKEPLEHLTTVPLLLLNYVKRSKKKYARELRSHEGGTSNMTFPQPPAAIRREAEKKKEFWPQGDERVAKIYHEFKDKSGAKFWLVKFFTVKSRKVVRRSVMEYFFPISSVTFLYQQEERARQARSK